MSESSDRNLVAGLLALQLDFISRDQLIHAMQSWVLNKSRALELILVDQGIIEEETGSLLSTIVRKHLQQHQDQPQRSLAAMQGLDNGLRRDLTVIPDSDLHASIGLAAAEEAEMPPPETAFVSLASAEKVAGRFRVLRPHQRGGLGEVFVAHDNELQREVALKMIQTQFADAKESQERFLLEARVTGGLEHPGIVPVYSLGQYGDGRPYYAMRFIQGATLSESIKALYANGRTASRLELHKLLGSFVDVCNAVGYAHSRGVLHRDLKPSNMMLGNYGETLVVDWGLVKMIGRSDRTDDDHEPERTLQLSGDSTATEAGRVFGTPAYMSPEQAAGRVDELGPASDVYSLGATLYCILTGMPPYQQKAPEDVLKAVMAGNFVPPRQRNAEVPPPLEAICLKAMARHPDDRYRSARALAEDVERWMADEPVHAWPEPVAARCWRWASRHRTSIVAAAAVLLAVIGIVFGVQNNMLQSANVLLADKNDQLDAARAEAVTRSQRAAETLTELNDELDSLQPDESVFRVVLPNIVQLADELSDETGKQVQLAKAFGGAFERLGLYSEQTAAWQTVYDLSLAEYGKTHEDTIAALGNLAGATLQAGRQDEALPLLQEAVTLCRQKFGAEHGNTLNAVNNLAVALQDAGDVTAAIPHFKEVLRIRLAVDGEESPDTLTAMSNFATALRAMGEFNAAAEEFARARALQQEHLRGDMRLGLGLTNNLGMAWLDAGDVDRARALFDEAAVAFEEEYGEGHPLALIFRNNVALADHVAGHYEKSIPLFRAVLDGKRNVLPEDHPSIVTSESNLANALDDVGQFQEAEQLHLKIVQFRRGSGENPNPPDVALATALAMLARNQLLQGNYAFAETVCREALPIMESESPEHWRHFDTQSLLGGALLGQERYDAAEPLLLSGFEGMQQRSKTIPSATKSRQPEAAQRLVDLYVAMGNTAATEKWNAELDRLTPQPRTTPSGTN